MLNRYAFLPEHRRYRWRESLFWAVALIVLLAVAGCSSHGWWRYEPGYVPPYIRGDKQYRFARASHRNRDLIAVDSADAFYTEQAKLWARDELCPKEERNLRASTWFREEQSLNDEAAK